MREVSLSLRISTKIERPLVKVEVLVPQNLFSDIENSVKRVICFPQFQMPNFTFQDFFGFQEIPEFFSRLHYLQNNLMGELNEPIQTFYEGLGVLKIPDFYPFFSDWSEILEKNTESIWKVLSEFFEGERHKFQKDFKVKRMADRGFILIYCHSGIGSHASLHLPKQEKEYRKFHCHVKANYRNRGFHKDVHVDYLIRNKNLKDTDSQNPPFSFLVLSEVVREYDEIWSKYFLEHRS